ncbi:hypothetical protein BDR03DRAFT_985774 [Suillus americanus]|nr:hypothetical protein BDR03DRAFT_985774 [Suillus americanus]
MGRSPDNGGAGSGPHATTPSSSISQIRLFTPRTLFALDSRQMMPPIKTIELKKSELYEAKEMCNRCQIVVLEVVIFAQDNTSVEVTNLIMIQNLFNEGNYPTAKEVRHDRALHEFPLQPG